MAKEPTLQVQEKKELTAKGEKTVPARYYVPATDIYETDAALTVVMEMPGVERDACGTIASVRVSAVTGAGIDELRAALAERFPASPGHDSETVASPARPG